MNSFLPQQTASTGPEYPPAPSLGHQEVFPFEKKCNLVTDTNGCQLASKRLIKFGGRKTEIKEKANEKKRRKTPDPDSTGIVDQEPDQRIHNDPIRMKLYFEELSVLFGRLNGVNASPRVQYLSRMLFSFLNQILIRYLPSNRIKTLATSMYLKGEDAGDRKLDEHEAQPWKKKEKCLLEQVVCGYECVIWISRSNL
jgi:hypothetical protein